MLSGLFGPGTRLALPGGGSAILPPPYDRKPSYPTYGERIADEVLTGYRNWRPTMSGQPECDGTVTVGRSDRFESLNAFRNISRGALSIHWSAADEIPGQRWTGDEKKFPRETREGRNGPELVQLLSVGRVGFFRPYDDPALMYLVDDKRGVMIGVWIANKRGGVRAALRIAERIAASFQV